MCKNYILNKLLSPGVVLFEQAKCIDCRNLCFTQLLAVYHFSRWCHVKKPWNFNYDVESWDVLQFLTWHIFYFNFTVSLYFCLSDKLVISTSSHQIRNWLLWLFHMYLIVFVRITPCSGDYTIGERNTDVRLERLLNNWWLWGFLC